MLTRKVLVHNYSEQACCISAILKAQRLVSRRLTMICKMVTKFTDIGRGVLFQRCNRIKQSVIISFTDSQIFEVQTIPEFRNKCNTLLFFQLQSICSVTCNTLVLQSNLLKLQNHTQLTFIGQNLLQLQLITTNYSSLSTQLHLISSSIFAGTAIYHSCILLQAMLADYC